MVGAFYYSKKEVNDMNKSTDLLGKTVTIDGITYVVDRLHTHTDKVGLTAKHITKFKTVHVSDL